MENTLPTEEPRKPVEKWFANGVEVAAWQNTNKDNENFLSFTVQKKYKDKVTGEWKVGSFTRTDLAVLAQLTNAAFQYSQRK